MSAPRVDPVRIRDHVLRMQERFPPIRLGSADYTVVDLDRVRGRFAQPIKFMARVELEVERNVLELAMMLPGVSETDRLFYQDVWAPQEQHHGVLLDTLVQNLGLPPSAPELAPARHIRLLGKLAHLPPIQEIIRLLYYVTGAATEKSAILAYQSMSTGLQAMGESALKRTIIDLPPGFRAAWREVVDAPTAAAGRALLALHPFADGRWALRDPASQFGGGESGRRA